MVDLLAQPLAGDVGDDLERTNAPEYYFLKSQLDEQQRPKFSEMFEKGEWVLRERSKDLRAGWALAGGLMWSNRFNQAEGFATSCRAIRLLCENFWEQMYPRDLKLRNVLLGRVAKWWDNYVSKCEGAPRSLLQEAREELVGLRQYLYSVTPGGTEAEKRNALPSLGAFDKIVQGLNGIVMPAATRTEAQAAPTPAPAAANGQPESTSTSTSSTPPERAEEAVKLSADSLEVAFERAMERFKEGRTEQGLLEFQERLKSCGRLADRVRGRVFLGELYLKAGLSTHAKRVLQYTHEEVDKIKLSDWDPALCSRLWSNLIQAHQRAKDEKPNDNLLADLFANLCLIDPATAASLEPIKKA